MTSKVVAVTSIGQVGVTFLDWSLHWLSGDQQVYNVNANKFQRLPSNPIDQNNAHLHPKNHPCGHGGFLHDWQTLAEQHTDSFHSIYAAPAHIPNVAATLGITDNELKDPRILDWIKTTVALDYAKIFKADVPIIYIHTGVENSCYQLLSLSRGSDQGYLGFHQWLYQNPTASVWDQRETIALQLRIENSELENPFINFSRPHLWINAQEYWHNTREIVTQCMDYIKQPIDNTRWDTWSTAHQSWQDIQQPMIKFARNLDHIVKAIVNNWNYPLPKLSLLEEAIIQHCLIYQHNVNIRNWQLQNFPDNTNKLHQLLEQNQHRL